MKSSKPAPIREVLARAIEGIAAKQESPLYKEDIKRAWGSVVGKEASRHSTPARLKGGVLIVNVDSPVWIYQLNVKRAEIEQKLNRLIKQKSPLKVSFRAGES